MSNIKKKDAIRIVVDCAEKYRDNLLKYSLLFILLDKHNKTSYLEVSFNASNFMHLTGLKMTELTSDEGSENTDYEDKSLVKISAREFFERCLRHELSEKDFEFADDGTTELKLEVLPMMMTANLGAHTVGNYNEYKPMLYTEKLVGGVKGCMGFRKDSNTHWMIPDTILREDISRLASNRLRIIATYRKLKTEELYSERVYLAKKVDWLKIKYPEKYSYIPVPENLVKHKESANNLSVSEEVPSNSYTKEQISMIEAYTSSATIFVNCLSKDIEEAVNQVQVPDELREEVMRRLKKKLVDLE